MFAKIFILFQEALKKDQEYKDDISQHELVTCQSSSFYANCTNSTFKCNIVQIVTRLYDTWII